MSGISMKVDFDAEHLMIVWFDVEVDGPRGSFVSRSYA